MIRPIVVAVIAIFAGLGWAAAAGAQQADTLTYSFDFGPGPAAPGYMPVPPTMRYSEQRGYGFLDGARLAGVEAGSDAPSVNDAVTSDAPFYFIVDVPEGDYRVRVTLGAPSAASQTTVKAESRRLMLEDAATAHGQFVTDTFTVNVRK